MNEKIVGFTLGTPLNPSVLKRMLDMTGYASETYVKEYAQPKGSYLESSELPNAINEALAQAKAGGEFNGKDGVDGKDGYTPVKGVDYFDGKNGTNGKDGVDGKTPVKGEDYYTEEDKTEMVNAVVEELNLPSISAEENGKIAQVVNGTLTFVPVKDSSIATFIDEYISSALEGDY